MSDREFIVGNKYTKSDIYAICGVPANKQKGNWNTGYTNYDGDWFILCNIGTPGRTGHDYANRFVGDKLHWFGKTASHVGQDSIQSLLNPDGNVFVFTEKQIAIHLLSPALPKPLVGRIQLQYKSSGLSVARPNNALKFCQRRSRILNST